MPGKFKPTPYEPIVTPKALDDLKSALSRFSEAVQENRDAAAQAREAVALTLGWVGVGEKVVALATTVIEARQKTASTPDDRTRLADAGAKLTEFANLAKTLRNLLSGINA